MIRRFRFLDMVLHLHQNKFEHPREQLIILVHWTFLSRDFIILKDNEYNEIMDGIKSGKKSVDISQFRHSLITYEFRKIMDWKKSEKNSIDVDYFRENLIIHVEQFFDNENFIIQFKTDENNQLVLEIQVNDYINEKDGSLKDIDDFITDVGNEIYELTRRKRQMDGEKFEQE
ncbi:unnamed protein product [Rotaria sordida]|uniref:Uncharacterized protein n=1 Tax=Rotaria sordida TaxID=392033 RepID=A0A814F5L9_9BILA|nr:unnamed protein product [Rotaria sordida]